MFSFQFQGNLQKVPKSLGFQFKMLTKNPTTWYQQSLTNKEINKISEFKQVLNE